MSLEDKYRYLEKAYPEILVGIGKLIQKGKLSKQFDSILLADEEQSTLIKAKDLCELRIIELWEEKEKDEFKALCSTYFDIASILGINLDDELSIYEYIKLISLGYLGEHWHFVKKYLLTLTEIDKIETPKEWNKRLLTTSFKALVYLIKKDSWGDVKKSIEFIEKLREEQGLFEDKFLKEKREGNQPYAAAELVSMYHLAKSIEILGDYLIKGVPIESEGEIKYHIKMSREFAQKSGNITLDLLLQYFEGFSIGLIRNTIWYSTRGVNSLVSNFNKFVAKRKPHGIFELLYPQKRSINKGKLLDLAQSAILLNLPTSSGKTLIAEYRMLVTLNQFKEKDGKHGWIAYVVPTKTLVNQMFIQLNKDLAPIGLKIEKTSGAMEIDGFEQQLVEKNGDNTDFDILIITYEKMNLLVRQGLGTSEKRPLVLVVVDEAHNIGEKSRGLNLEMLLSTIRSDCQNAIFLLMTPEIPNSQDIVDWLGGEKGNVINLDIDWWQPNERVIGAVYLEGKGKRHDYILKTLHTDKGTYKIGNNIPILHKENAQVAISQMNTKIRIASYLAADIVNMDSPMIILASRVNDTYKIADILYREINQSYDDDEDVDLLIRFVKSELGDSFPLVNYLKKRIAVHSSALPDEIRFLIEDLMVKEKLQALVATTTIAQGINFPISAVIIGGYNYPFSGPMPPRDFWNLVGRVGRVGQKSMGWVGIVSRDKKNELLKISKYVKETSKALISQLVDAIDNAIEYRYANEGLEKWLWKDERWSALFQYISHLRTQVEDINEFIAHLEQELQRTFGYRQLPEDKKRFLTEKIREYASSLSLSDAKKADATGFSTVSLRQMVRQLEEVNLTPVDWEKSQLFSENNQTMKNLIGIMLNTYEIRKSLEEISSKYSLDRSSIARMIIQWVNGKNIVSIARRVFPTMEERDAIQKTTRALYKVIANAAVWGLSALQKLPRSGIDWDNLDDIERRKIANIPAYLYYGVNTDEGVLMRKNNIPRSIANNMGNIFKQEVGDIYEISSSDVLKWLEEIDDTVWQRAIPAHSHLTSDEYRKIWEKLNGK